MKKIIFSICFLSIISISASEFKCEVNLNIDSKLVENIQEVSSHNPSIQHGFAFADTSQGTCMTYGIWITDSEGDSIFQEADKATLFTMGLPKCTGAGTFLV